MNKRQRKKLIKDNIRRCTGLSSVRISPRPLATIGVNFTNSQKAKIYSLMNRGKKLQAQRIILNELVNQFGY